MPYKIKPRSPNTGLWNSLQETFLGHFLETDPQVSLLDLPTLSLWDGAQELIFLQPVPMTTMVSWVWDPQNQTKWANGGVGSAVNSKVGEGPSFPFPSIPPFLPFTHQHLELFSAAISPEELPEYILSDHVNPQDFHPLNVLEQFIFHPLWKIKVLLHIWLVYTGLRGPCLMYQKDT